MATATARPGDGDPLLDKIGERLSTLVEVPSGFVTRLFCHRLTTATRAELGYIPPPKQTASIRTTVAPGSCPGPRLTSFEDRDEGFSSGRRVSRG